MRRSNRVKWSELWVGIFVMLAFAMVMWASFFGGGTSIFEKKNYFTAYFKSVNGLTPGSPVWMQGVEVGNVRSITFDEERRKIKVVGKVAENVWHMVTSDSKAKIAAIGLIGDKYIEVIPGTPTAPRLEHEGVIEVVEDDADKIFREGADAIEGVNRLNESLQELINKMNSGEGTLGRIVTDPTLYDELSKTVKELNRTLKTLNENQERAFANLEKGVNSFEKLTTALTDTNGTVGRMLSDTALYVNLSQLTGDLAGVVAKIDSGQGTLGALANDDQVYIKTRDLLARLENLLLDMETNPKKYFKVSVF